VPEGVEGSAVQGRGVATCAHQLTRWDLTAAMGYLSAAKRHRPDFHKKAKFWHSRAGACAESHVHDVTINARKPELSEPGW